MRIAGPAGREEGWTPTWRNSAVCASGSGRGQVPPQCEDSESAPGGPSGMSGERLKTVLESPSCLGLLSEVAAHFARAKISEEVVKVARLGRMTALQKLAGWVHRRGRRVPSFGREHPCPTVFESEEAASHPFQHALHESRGVSPISFRRSQVTETTILSMGFGACAGTPWRGGRHL